MGVTDLNRDVRLVSKVAINTWRLLNNRHFRCGIEILSALVMYHQSLLLVALRMFLKFYKNL